VTVVQNKANFQAVGYRPEAGGKVIADCELLIADLGKPVQNKAKLARTVSRTAADRLCKTKPISGAARAKYRQDRRLWRMDASQGRVKKQSQTRRMGSWIERAGP
jgi:hypothetical protein